MQTILFLHGALGSASQFDSIISKLNPNYNCIAINFPKHGDNSIDCDFTISNFTDYLIQYLENNFTEKIFIFGYSMGGYIALNAAVRKPELFSGIITLATKFNWDEEIAMHETSMLNPDIMEQKIPAFVQQLKNTHQYLDWRELISRTKNLMIDLGNFSPLSKSALQTIDVKVMVGLGDKDNMVSIDETLNTFRELKNGSFYLLPNTKHPLEKVNYELLIAHVDSFIKS